MTEFDRATTPEPLGDGRYRATMDRGWWITRGPNGGYVAAIIVRAMEAELAMPERQLRSVTVHYPRVPPEGEVEVHVSVERSGRSLSTVSARLVDGDTLIALAVGAFSGAYASPVSYDEAEMPGHAPMPDPMPPAPVDGPMPFSRQWRMKGALGRHDRPVTGGWMAPREEHPVDAALLVALADAWIPAPFVVTGAPFAAPTIDLTVHVRAALPRPAGPVLGEFRSSLSRDGFFEEDGRLWAPDGTLLAQSRQLALAL
jgi:acyl-CoA thioesterase